jgi:hypothetical protein
MIHGVGNLLYFQGEVRFSTRHEEEQRYWVAKLLRFEENKIRSVEQFFGPLSPIGSLESTSHPASIARHGSQP